MASKNITVGIDVGTTKVCTIVAESDGVGGVRVLGVGLVKSKGLAKGMVVNIPDAREAVTESVKRAEQSSGCHIESAYVGVTGRHVTATNNKGVVAINRNDRLVRPDDLRRVLDSARSVRVSNDRRLLHVIPRSYAVDGQAGVRNPVGMHGFRLDVETHVITAAAASVQNLVKCVRSTGVDIEDLVLEPLASSEAILTPDEKQVGVVMADIGGGTTDISIFREGSIWHTAVLPVAGYQLTRDVAIGLGLPFDVAEEMKKRYASVLPVKNGAAEPPAEMSQDGHGVSYHDLCDIIRARVEEILRLVYLELPSGDYDSLVPAGLVLTGGGANMKGIAPLGREMLKMPVRVGTPSSLNGISDTLLDPCYATAVGLVLWGMKNDHRESWKGKLFGAQIFRMVSMIKRLLG